MLWDNERERSRNTVLKVRNTLLRSHELSNASDLPLMERVYISAYLEYAKELAYLDRYLVSSDSRNICEDAAEYNSADKNRSIAADCRRELSKCHETFNKDRLQPEGTQVERQEGEEACRWRVLKRLYSMSSSVIVITKAIAAQLDNARWQLGPLEAWGSEQHFAMDPGQPDSNRSEPDADDRVCGNASLSTAFEAERAGGPDRRRSSTTSSRLFKQFTLLSGLRIPGSRFFNSRSDKEFELRSPSETTSQICQQSANARTPSYGSFILPEQESSRNSTCTTTSFASTLLLPIPGEVQPALRQKGSDSGYILPNSPSRRKASGRQRRSRGDLSRQHTPIPENSEFPANRSQYSPSSTNFGNSPNSVRHQEMPFSSQLLDGRRNPMMATPVDISGNLKAKERGRPHISIPAVSARANPFEPPNSPPPTSPLPETPVDHRRMPSPHSNPII
ncbi:hypothetical protein NliqN6_5205 [Naganishia liquefaciens]|uniref:Uncharacterized protein n=1 Tax=Naganishia liquefaciens TaxID=104408 RepID=A0A8H3TXT4_9TREE|nr:hypothetical protein NliqN6_5205 [Naganishia liquefaciens]